MKPCECGCGQPAPIAARGQNGVKRGESQRFVFGHQARRSVRGYVPRNAGRTLSHGYVRITLPETVRRTRPEHVLIAERAVGGPLPAGAEVHHVNEQRGDNRHENLVICEDHAYHALLHLRMSARRETGNASARRCAYGSEWILPEDLGVHRSASRWYHRQCEQAYKSRRRNIINKQQRTRRRALAKIIQAFAR